MKKFVRVEPTDTHVVGDKFKRAVVVKRFKTEDGLRHEFTTFCRENHHGVAILALTPESEVIVSRQFRPGRERYVYDLPGGTVEPGETFELAARRELLEESGYEPGEIRPLGVYSWGPYDNLKSHYFLATNCRPAERENVDPLEIEQGLEVAAISIRELFKQAMQDNVIDVCAIFLAYDFLCERSKNETSN